MSRWFRHYAGMMRDEKLVRAALRAKQPIERVVWVWGAILESAAEINNGGRFDLEAGEIAYFLRADEADILSIWDALEAMGRLCSGVVVKWGDRQFQSDKSAERQRRFREKRGSTEIEAADPEVIPSRDGEVTAVSRHGDAPETETETELETDTEKKVSRAVAKATRTASDEKFEELWILKPSRGKASNPRKPAKRLFERLLGKGIDPDKIIAALKAKVGFDPDKIGTSFAPMLSTWLSEERFDSGPSPPPRDPDKPRWLPPEGAQPLDEILGTYGRSYAKAV